MCLAAIAIGVHPDYPFICVANRDEFHDRPTAPLQAWQSDSTTVFSGKDLQSGGSWLAVGSNAQFALLTNVRNSVLNMPATAPSRGELVINAVAHGLTPNQSDSLRYAGFNLIHGNLSSANFHYCSNQGMKLNNGLAFSNPLNKGVYSLSNGHLGSNWPKSRQLQQQLSELIGTSIGKGIQGLDFEQALIKLLANTQLAQDYELPSTGVPYEWEKMLSAVKIVSPLYGTRSSAVVLLDTNNTIYFTELSFNPAGQENGRQRFEIPLSPKS